MSAAAVEQELQCPDCDFVAQTRTGLSSHLRSKHGIQGMPKAEKVEPDLDEQTLREVDEAVNAATQALTAKVAELDAAIAEGDRKLRQQKATRKYLASRLRAINPDALPEGKPGPKQGKQTMHDRQRGLLKDPEKIAAIESYVRQIDGEFLATKVYEMMRADRPNGAPEASSEAVRYVIRQMHERGELRAVAITRGGGQSYAVIGGSNGASS